MERWIAGIFLVVVSGIDVRKKQLPLSGLLIAVGIALILQIAGVLPAGKADQPFRFAYDWVAGGVFGIALLGLGKVTGEALGYGDGIVLAVIGILLGLCSMVEIFFLGLCLSALYAAYLFFFRKAGGKERFAFLPFLFGGYLCWCLL